LIAGLRCRGIEVSEEGGNPLTDSAAVQHILSAMTLADHPGDKIAKFHLSCGKLADESSSQIRGDLVNDGYGLTVERLAKKLTASCNQREFQRLQKLTELAHRFDKTAKGVRTKRFIKIVQTTRVESPTGDDIRVMTIHKSKGLEFDVVVLPELDLHLSDSQPKILVARKTPMSPIDFVLRYVEKNLQPLLPEKYQQAFDVRMQGHIEESLSLLYVAMTRARSELVMMIPEKSRKGLSTFAGVLRCALAEQSKEQAAEQTTPQATPQPKILFETGTKNWFTPTKIKIKTEKQPVIQLDCELPPDKLYRHLPRTSASSLELDLFTVGEPETSNAATTDSVTTTFPKRNQDDALLRGIAMHACFEHGLQKNPWLDESKPDSNFLKQVIETAVLGKRGKIDSQEIVAQFLEACGKPNLRKVLSRSNYVAETVDVEHERRFAVRFDDELLHGYIDRLVIFRKSGKVVGLEIIDYKTGHFDVNRNEADFLAERQKVYAPQLKTYRKGMSRLYRIDPQTIKTTLLFVDIDRVVTID
jgi:ATP-dependent exoDNAse (exonuclease V) beta subunit